MLDYVELPAAGVLTLVCGERRAQDGNQGLDATVPERGGKVEDVAPDAADGVRCHQHSADGGASADTTPARLPPSSQCRTPAPDPRPP